MFKNGQILDLVFFRIFRLCAALHSLGQVLDGGRLVRI